MNAVTKSAQDILQDLHAWNHVARGLYDNAGQRHDTPGLRALKIYLAERHTEHLRELRHCLHDIGGLELANGRSHPATLLELGHEMLRSLVSTNRLVVIQACSAVEKQVALAYQLALADPALVEVHAREIIGRHASDLESSQTFVQQIQMETRRASPGPTTSRTVATTSARGFMTAWWSR